MHTLPRLRAKRASALAEAFDVYTQELALADFADADDIDVRALYDYVREQERFDVDADSAHMLGEHADDREPACALCSVEQGDDASGAESSLWTLPRSFEAALSDAAHMGLIELHAEPGRVLVREARNA